MTAFSILRDASSAPVGATTWQMLQNIAPSTPSTPLLPGYYVDSSVEVTEQTADASAGVSVTINNTSAVSQIANYSAQAMS